MVQHYMDVFYQQLVSMDVDSEIISHFQLGLLIGLLWITTLSFFPGKPLGIQYGTTDEPITPLETDKHVSTTATAESSTKSGHDPAHISPEELEKIRIKLGLTKEELKEVIEKSKSSEELQKSLATPLYKIVNRLVYVAAFAVLFFVADREYNNCASWWFAKYFPKEAATMGMFVPEAIER